MIKNENTQKVERNLKLFPKYKSIASDYLFYYTTDFLFLTQIKNISPADVVLSVSMESLFGIFL